MVFKPEELPEDSVPLLVQDVDGLDAESTWHPLYHHDCTFNPDAFIDVMVNQIKNPNINSSWLFRADILHDTEGLSQASSVAVESGVNWASPPRFSGFELRRSIIRRLIPRNTMRDKPLDQTCLIYDSATPESLRQTLVVYLPHVSSPEEMPFYHPEVRGIAFLHGWTSGKSDSESESESGSCGCVSVSYLHFKETEPSAKAIRTAFHLLQAIYKHGQGRAEGYQKRVHHDLLVPQARLQNTYMGLKKKYAKALIVGWAETTDPGKHVFEDLCIAAFLIELWAGMYGQGSFPGFVDIGCGNGLLVYILNQEGYKGWGFDARVRKSWQAYSTQLDTVEGPEDSLRQFVLLPPPAAAGDMSEIPSDGFDRRLLHDGRFPKGTFIVSNHADELTPWTPILAAISDCPFIMIPCCSHDLTGKKFRAPPPKDKTKADSAYSSLVAWVSKIAQDCGWEPEQEMLRIPSTRNTAIVGRKRVEDTSSVDISAIVDRYGGTAGYLETVIKLVKTSKSKAPEENIRDLYVD